ncbi:MAG: hypothetical protein MUC82_01420 [Cypionkella sp.]|nr:hypothetical protein [Cypionkella sp.]
MTMSYDFDIFAVIPEAGSPDPDLDGFLTGIGFKPGPETARVALFRDPRTAKALADAPAALRDYFLASGFGLNTYSSGAPAGCYPAVDEDARLHIIQRLTANARTLVLPDAETTREGGEVFRLGAFLDALEHARPVAVPMGPQRFSVSGHSAGAVLRGLPDVFETEPLAVAPPEAEDKAPPRRFWHNRFFRRAVAAGVVICAVAGALHLTGGQAVLTLARL